MIKIQQTKIDERLVKTPKIFFLNSPLLLYQKLTFGTPNFVLFVSKKIFLKIDDVQTYEPDFQLTPLPKPHPYYLSTISNT